MRAAVTRKLDSLGRIVIPIELRRLESLSAGTEMDILMEDNGDIILRRTLSQCFCCGGIKGLTVFNGKALCGNCRRKLHKEHNDGI